MLSSIEVFDRAGIAVAVTCALHCVATPTLAASTQVAGVFASERAEFAFLITSPISGTAVVVSCLRRGARRAVWGMFVAGAGLVVAARIGGDWAEAIEQRLIVAGAALIVAAHFANLFACGCRKEGSSCVVTG